MALTMALIGSFLGRAQFSLPDERPLLIIGHPGSGTTQMAYGLRELGLDIGHEASSSHDGTIGWMYAARFWNETLTAESMDLLCNPVEALQPMWHPLQFDRQHCSESGRTLR